PTAISAVPDGRMLALAAADYGSHNELRVGNVRLLDTVSEPPRVVRTMQQGPQVAKVAFAPDGATLAFSEGSVGQPSVVKLWDLAAGKVRHTLAGHRDLVSALAYSPDGTTLATGDFVGQLTLWNAATGQRLDAKKVQPHPILGVAYGS